MDPYPRATVMAGVALVLAMAAAAGCGRPGEANAAGPDLTAERTPLALANRTGGRLTGVAVNAGGTSISFGEVAAGQTEVVSLNDGLRATELELTWRDAGGQRRYQTLAVGDGPVRGASVTINEAQEASLSIR